MVDLVASNFLALRQMPSPLPSAGAPSAPAIPPAQTGATSPNFNVNSSVTEPTQAGKDAWSAIKRDFPGDEQAQINKLKGPARQQVDFAINADAKAQYAVLMKLDAKDRQAYAQSLPQAVKDRVNEFIVADTASAANDAAKLQAMMQFAISVGTLVHQLVTKRAYGGAVQDTINRSSQMLAQTIAPVKTGVELISGGSAGAPTTPVAKPAQATS